MKVAYSWSGLAMVIVANILIGRYVQHETKPEVSPTGHPPELKVFLEEVEPVKRRESPLNFFQLYFHGDLLNVMRGRHALYFTYFKKA